MMNQSRVKPLLAPSFGVTINSPETTMVAVMIRPGPRWRSMSPEARRGRLRRRSEGACGGRGALR